MRKAAEKKKKGNFAMLTPFEGLEIVQKYYELTGTVTPAMMLPDVSPATIAPPKSEITFNVKLEDLLK